MPTPPAGSTAARGARTGAGSSVHEAVTAIEAMLARGAPGRHLFIVVDEVSQYVHQDHGRMLKLQSFVSELGHRMKGGVWLLATGQQKLEDQAEHSTSGQVEGSLSAGAAGAPRQLDNIRDVVHKRLLRKKPEREAELRALFAKHRADLKLYGYRCESLTEEDFVEVYPMLPGADRAAHADHDQLAHAIDAGAGRRLRHPGPAAVAGRAVP